MRIMRAANILVSWDEAGWEDEEVQRVSCC